MARVWREGQLKPVIIYRLLTTGRYEFLSNFWPYRAAIVHGVINLKDTLLMVCSIEEKIYQRQIMKGGMSAAVEGDGDGQNKKGSVGRHFSNEELRELFTLYLVSKSPFLIFISLILYHINRC